MGKRWVGWCTSQTWPTLPWPKTKPDSSAICSSKSVSDTEDSLVTWPTPTSPCTCKRHGTAQAPNSLTGQGRQAWEQVASRWRTICCTTAGAVFRACSMAFSSSCFTPCCRTKQQHTRYLGAKTRKKTHSECCGRPNPQPNLAGCRHRKANKPRPYLPLDVPLYPCHQLVEV